MAENRRDAAVVIADLLAPHFGTRHSAGIAHAILEELRDAGVVIGSAGHHEYLSTACWHAQNDGLPDLHTSCRNSCKYAAPGRPEYCVCPCHGEAGTQPGRSSWVDQARGTALRLLQHLNDADVDLSTVDPHLARAITDDPAFFWARGEEAPPGQWRPQSSEGETPQ